MTLSINKRETVVRNLVYLKANSTRTLPCIGSLVSAAPTSKMIARQGELESLKRFAKEIFMIFIWKSWFSNDQCSCLLPTSLIMYTIAIESMTRSGSSAQYAEWRLWNVASGYLPTASSVTWIDFNFVMRRRVWCLAWHCLHDPLLHVLMLYLVRIRLKINFQFIDMNDWLRES